MTRFFPAIAAALVVACSSPARAEDIMVNGLPCNELCRLWMGIKMPVKPQRSERPAISENADHEETKASREPSASRKKARDVAAIAHRRKTHASDVEAPSPARRVESATQEPRLRRPAPETTPPLAKTEGKPPDHAPEPQATPAPVPAAKTPNAATPVVTAAPASIAPAEPTAPGPDKQQGSLKVEAPNPPAVAIAPAPSRDPPVTRPPDEPAPLATKTPQASQDAPVKAEPNPDAPVQATGPTPLATETSGQADASAAPPPPAPPEDRKPVDPAPQPSEPMAKTGEQVAIAPQASHSGETRRVMLVLTNKDVNSVTELNNRSVLIAGVDSITSEDLRASFAAAGAGAIVLKRGKESDVDQLASGEVAGAVVAIVAPEVAEAMSKTQSLHMLRVDVASEPKP